MDKINWSQLSISFQYKSGQIGEKKVEKIVNELSALGITVDATIKPSPDVAIFMLANLGCSFIIMPENVAYSIPNIENRFEIAAQHLKAIMEVLAVEDGVIYVANVQGDTETENSHAESKKRFIQNHGEVLKSYPDIYGVGYRFLIKSELYSGELKIEPLITDCSKYYYQYVINALSTMGADEFCDLIKECLDNEYKPIREVL